MEFTDEKIIILNDANLKLHIPIDNNSEKSKNIIFVYSPPKVGSTSLVSSIRLSCCQYFTTLHLHDELMIQVLAGIQNITINEIIQYNKYLGKNVFVIDIYRSPIEQKISAFFEKLTEYHYNTSVENLGKYDIYKIINRFNNIFPYLSNNDYYKEIYNIPFPDTFDFNNNCLNQDINGIKYIKLRLKDSNEWGNILKNILNYEIVIIKDYKTENKPIKNIFLEFKDKYKIPQNLLNMVKDDVNLNYYYSLDEIDEYISFWSNNIGPIHIPYKTEEYNLYSSISLENQLFIELHKDHYIDTGCSCGQCSKKRISILSNIQNGDIDIEHINHEKENIIYKNKINNFKTKKIIAFIKLKNSLLKQKKNPIKNNFKKTF